METWHVASEYKISYDEGQKFDSDDFENFISWIWDKNGEEDFGDIIIGYDEDGSDPWYEFDRDALLALYDSISKESSIIDWRYKYMVLDLLQTSDSESDVIRVSLF